MQELAPQLLPRHSAFAAADGVPARKGGAQAAAKEVPLLGGPAVPGVLHVHPGGLHEPGQSRACDELLQPLQAPCVLLGVLGERGGHAVGVGGAGVLQRSHQRGGRVEARRGQAGGAWAWTGRGRGRGRLACRRGVLRRRGCFAWRVVVRWRVVLARLVVPGRRRARGGPGQLPQLSRHAPVAGGERCALGCGGAQPGDRLPEAAPAEVVQLCQSAPGRGGAEPVHGGAGGVRDGRDPLCHLGLGARLELHTAGKQPSDQLWRKFLVAKCELDGGLTGRARQGQHVLWQDAHQGGDDVIGRLRLGLDVEEQVGLPLSRPRHVEQRSGPVHAPQARLGGNELVG
mmetsp:Transcript_16559/g.62637  ORF Transcript_16559/g.62637 Transcript_16559/m.62637 type:complete len:343 (+) Transcript_16559:1349-2377(+)